MLTEVVETSLILLCWRKSDACYISVVKVASSDNETEIWQKIQGHWYERRGFWRKHVPFLKVQRLEMVEVKYTRFPKLTTS